ncbi:FIST signal transduction protein [Sedimenticola sp.]|uniref:FIST signal transduction protein n=1 Tax=Sedimenticola sp. TaxID=1940285 RepID=UPI003D13FE62
MRIVQNRWQAASGWDTPLLQNNKSYLVLVFAERALLTNGDLLREVRAAYPSAQIMGCSTAGEIMGLAVYDGTFCLTAIEFEYTRVKGTSVHVQDAGESHAVGREIARQLAADDLKHLFLLSDGLGINGSELVLGITESLPTGVTVTGGLSGDGDRFEQTLVAWNDVARRQQISAVGLYGERISVGCGSLGGWDSFGPERLITRSSGNVLYELDGQSALDLYKTYLGEYAMGLPATGLLFPLSLRLPDNETPIVRTILAVDEYEQSLTFAGDIPQGCYVRLMKANFDRLVDGASGAAETAGRGLRDSRPELAILISCVGRKLILKQRVEEEVEAVHEVLGDGVVLTGFYSYGEISPFTPDARCELHNQTMTITALSEH